MQKTTLTWSEQLRDEGRKEGLCEAVADLCEVLGIPLSSDQRAHLGSLDTAGLEDLRLHIKRHHAWPGQG